MKKSTFQLPNSNDLIVRNRISRDALAFANPDRVVLKPGIWFLEFWNLELGIYILNCAFLEF
jgi:hypothetical protein